MDTVFGATTTAGVAAPPPKSADHVPGGGDAQGRYRPIRLHARGGLGEVYVARDEELGREVALKEIQGRYADDPVCRARFVIEAQVTGGLEHPGIVPIYGLGHHVDGRPFYAMRFIRGDSFNEAIERFHQARTAGLDPSEQALEFRNLLARFVDVCNAIAYAHSRGVVHRDLKPGNVMLGKYGETLVVDWGLAKPMDRPGSSAKAGEEPWPSASNEGTPGATRPGSALGTPAYMSPEQARGDLDALSPRSDVYSLGATLYCLLTGKPAFKGDNPGDIIRGVKEGAILPPRRLEPALDPALEAICLKAMAMRPKDRYTSCEALVEDVESWLADEPVTAYREPIGRRARRWARRNRTVVATAAAALVMAAIGLGAVSAVQTKARNDLATVNSQLIRANTGLDAQRRKAVEREQLAIDAVKRFGDAVSRNTALKNSPVLEPLRQELLKAPLSFFKTLRDQLQSGHDTQPDSLVRLAPVAFDLARLTDEIGDKQDALRAHEEAWAIWERLARENRTVSAFESGLATSHNNIGHIQAAAGHQDLALESYSRALAIWERLTRDDPSIIKFQENVAATHSNIGALQSATGHPDLALESFGRALAIFERLQRENPTVTELQNKLAASHGNIGNLQRETGGPDLALKSYARALAIWERLAREGPAVAEYNGWLAKIYYQNGLLLEEMG
jgi:serine/threonine-protein kinase